MGVDFTDNSGAAIEAMEAAKKMALAAIGLAAVETTVDYMEHNYGNPIRQTGDLMRDVNFSVRMEDSAVDVGNSLEYAPWVHNGVARKAARPYLRDALTENTDIWKELAEEHLQREMKVNLKM